MLARKTQTGEMVWDEMVGRKNGGRRELIIPVEFAVLLATLCRVIRYRMKEVYQETVSESTYEYYKCIRPPASRDAVKSERPEAGGRGATFHFGRNWRQRTYFNLSPAEISPRAKIRGTEMDIGPA